MPEDIIIKTFKTYKHPYAYDRHTDTLIMLSEDEYSELARVEKGELSCGQSQAVRKYQEQGLFAPNIVEKIEHYGSVIIEQYMNTRMKQLILQVTQQCNLRCGYCTYSGGYDKQRTHTSRRMQYETAVKAIDFFLDRNNELPEVVIGFYGGEPLLEFGLIKRCVDYAKSRAEGKKIKFNMTTNGTLLTEDVADYLIENEFTIAISLDGSEAEHDANRRFANGEGSFSTIIENVRGMLKRHPEYARSITFMTTINPNIELDCVMEYFSTEELFSDKNIIFNSVNEVYHKGDLCYDEDYYGIRNFEYIKMLFSMVGKLDSMYVSPLVSRAKSSIERKQKSITMRQDISSMMHHGGPCMPGVMRFFVRVDGALFPCERVSEELDFFKIGTLEDGLDIDKMRRLLNIGKLTENECKKCWGLRHCMLCASQIEFDGSLSRGDKIKECPGCLSSDMDELHELCVLNEFGLGAERLRV